MYVWYGGIACWRQLVSRHYHFLSSWLNSYLQYGLLLFKVTLFQWNQQQELDWWDGTPCYWELGLTCLELTVTVDNYWDCCPWLHFWVKWGQRCPFLSVYQVKPKTVFQLFGPMGEWTSFMEERCLPSGSDLSFQNLNTCPIPSPKVKDLRDKQEKCLTSNFVFLEAHVLNFFSPKANGMHEFILSFSAFLGEKLKSCLDTDCSLCWLKGWCFRQAYSPWPHTMSCLRYSDTVVRIQSF